jgi:hypothetical protein
VPARSVKAQANVAAGMATRRLVAVCAMTVVEAVRDLYWAHWGEPSRRARFEVGEFSIEILGARA